MSSSSQLDENARHEVLRVIAYHRRDYDTCVLSVAAHTRPPTDIVERPTMSTLGDLDSLPIELVHAIVRCSDLYTVAILRLLNRRARVVVDTSFPYKYIALHTPNVIDALGRAGVASHLTVDQIFHALCAEACCICGGFGAFLWIPECLRCCIPCLRESSDLMPITERDARAAFGLTPKALVDIPVVVTLPGTYSLSELPYKKKRYLLSRKMARQASIKAHGGEQGLAAYIKSGTSSAKAAYERRLAARNLTREAYDSRGNLNNTVDDVSRFMVTTHLPYFDFSTRVVHYGLSCRGCQAALEKASRQTISSKQHYSLFDQRDRTYTEEGFFRHFEACADAQSIWNVFRTSS